MLVFTIVLNLLIALINCFIAVKIWRLRQKLAKIAKILQLLEPAAYYLLYFAPIVITPGQKNARNLKQKYRQLRYQLRLLQQILRFLNLGRKIWLGQDRRKDLQKIRKLASEELLFSEYEYHYDEKYPKKDR